jgi:integrase
MASANFFLKNPNGKDPTLVYLFFSYDNQRLKYSTGEKIHPGFWNPEKQRSKESRQFPVYREFNARLQSIETTAFNLYRKLLNDGTAPTVDALREGLDIKLFRKKESVENDLIQFAQFMIENSAKRPNTIKHYKQTVRILEEYRSYINRKIKFEDVNLEFYESFVKFSIAKGYSTNTIGGLIKNVKVFMNEAFDRKLTLNVEFKNRKFRTPDEEVESIYLTQDEVRKIYNLDIRQNRRLERVRDIFIIGCFSGLRFSDLAKLKVEHFNSDKLKIQTEKTGEVVIIPLHPFIKEILKKYGDRPPEIISNQKMNKYLKELGEAAGLDENVLIHCTKGGEKVSERYKKFELITVHTARRSFATNAYLNNVPTISIMKITGHRTEKAFLKYIKISQEDNANKLLGHPFFNQN